MGTQVPEGVDTGVRGVSGPQWLLLSSARTSTALSRDETHAAARLVHVTKGPGEIWLTIESQVDLLVSSPPQCIAPLLFHLLSQSFIVASAFLHHVFR